MNKFIILSGLVASLQILHAQSNHVNTSGKIETTSELLKALKDSPDFDSLKQKAASATDNETRAINLFAITAQYLNVKVDSSLKYIKQFNETPSKSQFWEANGLIIMGDIYLRLGNASMALENLLKGTKILQELNDSTGMGMAYWNLGKLYQNIGDTSTAITYYSNSIKISSKEKLPWSRSMGQLGNLYLELNRLDSALYYTRSAYELRQEDRNTYEPILLAQLGNIYRKKGDRVLAMQYYKTALEKAYPTSNLAAGSDAYIGMAMLFKEKNIYDSCYYYSREGLDLAQQLNQPDLIWKASRFLKDLFTERNILDSAFRYQEIMIAANDSMHSLEKINKVHVISFAEQQRLAEAAMQKKEFQNKIKQYVLVSSLAVFLIIAALLFRNNRQRQKAYALLKRQKEETDKQKIKTEETLAELKSTQSQLIQAEKMASLGELTAGIAHEIQNPLNFVNNFSEVNVELIDEMQQEMDKGNYSDAKKLSNDIKENEEKIKHHGNRADSIVKGMLQHSSASSGQKEPTDINALADEYLRLTYHGFRAKDSLFSATVKTDFDSSIGQVNIIPQDIGRVLVNLFNNSFYAVTEKKKHTGEPYEPTITVMTKKIRGHVEIRVRDNGPGIAQKALDKIFQPFFTTKPTGQGTGLGLSLSYDIITKGHGGELKVHTHENDGAEFIVSLPAP